jgi:hypothetical protein
MMEVTFSKEAMSQMASACDSYYEELYAAVLARCRVLKKEEADSEDVVLAMLKLKHR